MGHLVRSVVAGIAFFFGAIAPASAVSELDDSSSCRCIPDDACWPPPADWHLLNETVGGRLIQTSLLAQPCYDPQYDATACSALKAAWDIEVTQ